MAEIENFVEIAVEAAVEETAPEEIIHSFATIGAVFEDGVTLIFDGETEAGEKHYLCNTSIFFEAGQRVKLCRDSGTYVVEYIVGAPTANKPPQYVPDGGTDGQVLGKASADDYDLTWQTTHASNQLKTSQGYLVSLVGASVLPYSSGYNLGDQSHTFDLFTGWIRLYYNSAIYVTLTCNSSGKLCVNGTAIN